MYKHRNTLVQETYFLNWLFSIINIILSNKTNTLSKILKQIRIHIFCSPSYIQWKIFIFSLFLFSFLFAVIIIFIYTDTYTLNFLHLLLLLFSFVFSFSPNLTHFPVPISCCIILFSLLFQIVLLSYFIILQCLIKLTLCFLFVVLLKHFHLSGKY